MDEQYFYYCFVNCECDNEWVVIAEQERTVTICDECGLLNDVWVNNYLMTGTPEEVVNYLEETNG